MLECCFWGNTLLKRAYDVFNVKYDKDLLYRAIKENDKTSLNNVFVLNTNEGCIIVDCNNRDWIYSIVVISIDSLAEEVYKIMLKLDNDIRAEYGQEPVLCERDVFGKSDTLLDSIEEYYKHKIYQR